MGNAAEELRQRAQMYRLAAEKGPRRDRAQRLTLAYCLERQANELERTMNPDFHSFAAI
jgi:hypothetical protein